MPTNMCLLSPDSHSPISLALFLLIPPTYDYSINNTNS
jgi:hypothetical protein